MLPADGLLNVHVRDTFTSSFCIATRRRGTPLHLSGNSQMSASAADCNSSAAVVMDFEPVGPPTLGVRRMATSADIQEVEWCEHRSVGSLHLIPLRFPLHGNGGSSRQQQQSRDSFAGVNIGQRGSKAATMAMLYATAAAMTPSCLLEWDWGGAGNSDVRPIVGGLGVQRCKRWTPSGLAVGRRSIHPTLFRPPFVRRRAGCAIWRCTSSSRRCFACLCSVVWKSELRRLESDIAFYMSRLYSRTAEPCVSPN